MPPCAGMVLDAGESWWFVSAQEAQGIAPAEPVLPVPGMVPPAIGLVLTEEQVATALQVGSAPASDMIMCMTQGGPVALFGARVVATGVFELTEGQVKFQNKSARLLDVRQLTFDIEAALWRAARLGEQERSE
mgnify:FL=1